MTMLARAGRVLSALLSVAAAASMLAQPAAAQDVNRTGRPLAAPVTGSEYIDFRQGGVPVTAPLSSIFSALGGGGASAPVNPATLTSATTPSGNELLTCYQGGTAKACTTVQVGQSPVVISSLPSATAPVGSEFIPCVQGGLTKRCLASQLGQTWSVIGDGVLPPTSNVTAATAGAGGLTGTVSYLVSYVTALGETDPYGLDGSFLAVNSNQVGLTNIPIGPSGVIARKIYRTITSTASPNKDVRDVYLLTTIPDNTTTTFTDNIPDASLGAPARWASTNRAYFTDGSTSIGSFSARSTTYGFQSGYSNVGYAITAYGYRSLASMTSGRRDTAVGIFSLENCTTCYQDTALGTHAGNGITTGASNTLLGYAAGGTAGIKSGNFNTGVGDSALGSNTITGNGNVAVGYSSVAIPTGTVSYNTALGTWTGKYSIANFNLWIDAAQDRGSLANAQDNGLIWGVADISNAANQQLKLNGFTRIGSSSAATVASLPACTAALAGFRGYVTDASVAYNGTNLGTTVAGGGTNTVPVFCAKTSSTSNWVIG